MAVIDLSTFQEITGLAGHESTRRLALCSQLVGDYLNGGDAPDSLKNEAILRIAGYMTEATAYTATKITIGPITEEKRINHGNFMVSSGAAGILARHVNRRGGAIG